MDSKIEYMIGQNVKRLREQAKLTQDYIATQFQLRGCDITRSAIAKIEVGQRHIYPDEIILLKQILNVDYDDIFELK